MCSCHSILKCCIMFSGVKLSMGSFVLFMSLQVVTTQEVSNVRALQIFERKVLLSILNSRKRFERDLLSSDSVAKSATRKPCLGFLRLCW